MNVKDDPSPPRRRGPLSIYAARLDKADRGPHLRRGDGVRS